MKSQHTKNFFAPSFLVFFICLFAVPVTAQVGINNTDPKASLDITASNVATPTNTDGILIARIDDFSLVNPTIDQDGMLVFVTGNGVPTRGFYYWDNGTTSWILLGGIGVEKINDLNDGKSDNDGTNDGSSVFLGIDAGAADDSTDNRNVGIGYNSLKDNTTGNFNVANGFFSLQNNTTANENTAVGYMSLNSNVSGDLNTAIGSRALFSTTAGANTALGYRALFSNTSGSRNVANGVESLRNHSLGSDNVAIGYRAGYNNVSGYQNVFIGSSAGFNETANNRLYIESTNADADNALIYGEFDNNILRANAELQIGNPTGTGYAFPMIDGTANQVLTTDGAGQLSFITPPVNDADWYEEGSTNPPNAITDDIFTQGNVAIGKNTTDFPLEVQNNSTTASPFVAKFEDNATGTGDHTGVEVKMIGGHNQKSTGFLSTNTSSDSGLHIGYEADLRNGTNNQTGIKVTVRGNASNIGVISTLLDSGSPSTVLTRGISNNVGQPSSFGTYGIENGLYASGATATGNKYTVHNTILGGFGNHYGTYNALYSEENGNKYGVFNQFGAPAYDTGGVLYGTYNEFHTNISSTTSKYGTYTNIPASLGGTHYGIYADVQNTTGYAGYFLGRVSLGNTSSNRYIMPAADGTANQVLTTNGAGVTSWQNVSSPSSLSIIRATPSTNQNIPISSWAKLAFNTEIYDTNTEYDTSNYRFTAITTGYYSIGASVRITPITAELKLAIYVNGVSYSEVLNSLSGNSTSLTINDIVFLNASDYVEIYFYNGSASSAYTLQYVGYEKLFYHTIHQIE